MNRILYNERDKEIDEIVLTDVESVHVEQMDTTCWWIGIRLKNGGYWAGNFYTKRAPLTFTEQERDGFEWGQSDSHDEYVADAKQKVREP